MNNNWQLLDKDEEADNSFLHLQNSLDYKKAESKNCFIID